MHYLFEKTDSLNMPIECFVFDTAHQNFPIRPHWHYFYEVICITEGTAEMRCADDSYIMSEGDMIVFRSRAVHSIFAVDRNPLKYSVLKFDINRFAITTPYAPKLRSIFRQAEQQGMPIYFPREQAELMGSDQLFERCVEEVQQHAYGYDLMLQTNVYSLLMSIIRRWLEDGFVISDDEAESENYDIDSITEYIDSCMGEELRVADIAKQCGMSYSCFAKKFHETYGMSCKGYIERMRIFKAEELLLFTEHDLSYISQETGFSDCSHLIKSFKKLRGITPKQFRLSRKGKIS